MRVIRGAGVGVYVWVGGGGGGGGGEAGGTACCMWSRQHPNTPDIQIHNKELTKYSCAEQVLASRGGQFCVCSGGGGGGGGGRQHAAVTLP